MGMYDNIKCKMAMPENPPSFHSPDYLYQTKDFECELNTYEIDENGVLIGCEDFTGEIEFYSSNWSMLAYGMEFTRDGEDFESVEYKATIVSGKVTDIQEVSKERKPALSSSVAREIESKFKNQPDTPLEINLAEPEIGQKLWLQYYGGSGGREVTLACKTSVEYGVINEHDRINGIFITDFGRLLFHSKEDCEKSRNHEKGQWNLTKETLEEMLQTQANKAV